MTKIAKLVEVSLMVRILVDIDATEEQIIEATYPKLQARLDNREVGENIASIEDDTECPYDPEFDGAEVVCLNCGFDFISTKLNTHTDAIGKHCTCPKCQSSFDIDNDQSEEVYAQLVSEYAKSDVVSGEMYNKVKFGLEISEADVKKGIQKFLDWDESPVKFTLKRNKKYWKIIDL